MAVLFNLNALFLYFPCTPCRRDGYLIPAHGVQSLDQLRYRCGFSIKLFFLFEFEQMFKCLPNISWERFLINATFRNYLHVIDSDDLLLYNVFFIWRFGAVELE